MITAPLVIQTASWTTSLTPLLFLGPAGCKSGRTGRDGSASILDVALFEDSKRRSDSLLEDDSNWGNSKRFRAASYNSRDFSCSCQSCCQIWTCCFSALMFARSSSIERRVGLKGVG